MRTVSIASRQQKAMVDAMDDAILPLMCGPQLDIEVRAY